MNDQLERPLRIAFFTVGSESSQIILEEVARHASVVALVLPAPRASGWRSLLFRLFLARAERSIRRIARDRQIRTLRFGKKQEQVLRRLRELAPDLICVATFPFILSKSIREIPRLGALNVHPSILPRHRGSDPLFWTYYGNEHEVGVSVHWIDDGVDTGDVVATERFPLERGIPRATLMKQLARAGGALLTRAIMTLERGDSLPRTKQDELQASRDPQVSSRKAAIDYKTWPTERVWHFLHAGIRVLHDRHERPILIGRVLEYRVEPHDVEPGTVAVEHGAIRLFCTDGWVGIARPPRWKEMITTVLRRAR